MPNSLFIQNELTALAGKIYDAKFPAYNLANNQNGTQLLPEFSGSVPEGFRQIERRGREANGKAKIIARGTVDDIPEVSMQGAAMYFPVDKVGVGFKVAHDDLRSAGSTMTPQDILSSLAMIAKRASYTECDRYAAFGSGATLGAFNQVSTTSLTSTSQVIRSSASTAWLPLLSANNPGPVIDEINNICLQMHDLTEQSMTGVRIKVLVGAKLYKRLRVSRLETTGSTMYATQLLLANNPVGVNDLPIDIQPCIWLDDIAATAAANGSGLSSSRAVFFFENEDVISTKSVVPFTMEDAIQMNYGYSVPCRQEQAATMVCIPAGVRYLDGI